MRSRQGVCMIAESLNVPMFRISVVFPRVYADKHFPLLKGDQRTKITLPHYITIPSILKKATGKVIFFKGLREISSSNKRCFRQGTLTHNRSINKSAAHQQQFAVHNTTPAVVID